MMPLNPGPRMSASEDWEQTVRTISNYGEQIVQLLGRADRVYAINQLALKIEATEAGQIVEGTSFTKEHAQAIVAMLQSFHTWLETPLSEQSPTPEQIMFSR